MRARPLLAAGVLALAGLLTGCGAAPGPSSAGTTAPPARSSLAADLVGTTWSVEDADRVQPGTTARFDATSVAVTHGDRTSTLRWATQGDELLVTPGSTALNGPVATGWLTSAERAVPVSTGWALLDADGAPTAELTATHSATATPLPAVTPGPGTADAPADAIDGRWSVAGHPSAAITFTDGRWTASSSCETGTPGGSGAYRVLPGGRILVTRTIALRLGCPIARDLDGARATAIAGVPRATSFRVDGDTLTLFDRAGAAIGSLVR